MTLDQPLAEAKASNGVERDAAANLLQCVTHFEKDTDKGAQWTDIKNGEQTVAERRVEGKGTAYTFDKDGDNFKYLYLSKDTVPDRPDLTDKIAKFDKDRDAFIVMKEGTAEYNSAKADMDKIVPLFDSLPVCEIKK